jgi:hypothetical protein
MFPCLLAFLMLSTYYYAGWANRLLLFSKPCRLNLKLGEAAVAGGPTSPAQPSPAQPNSTLQLQGGGSASKHWPLREMR